MRRIHTLLTLLTLTACDSDKGVDTDTVDVGDSGTTAGDDTATTNTDTGDADDTGTEPVKDTDGDGLSDAQELELGTNPSDEDTDDDGLTDGEEVLTYGTDPFLEDTDSDGLSDGIEVAANTSLPEDGQLNPLSDDSNKDGILDGEEDSDGDGLTNIIEAGYDTDIADKDTDDDGYEDGVEVSYNTDPNSADQTPSLAVSCESATRALSQSHFDGDSYYGNDYDRSEGTGSECECTVTVTGKIPVQGISIWTPEEVHADSPWTEGGKEPIPSAVAVQIPWLMVDTDGDGEYTDESTEDQGIRVFYGAEYTTTSSTSGDEEGHWYAFQIEPDNDDDKETYGIYTEEAIDVGANPSGEVYSYKIWVSVIDADDQPIDENNNYEIGCARLSGGQDR